MEPTLRDGDWLLVDPLAFVARSPLAGELVVTAGAPWLVKRVAQAETDGVLTLLGDHPAHAADAKQIAASQVRGRPWFRYWPLRRLGRIR
jgi:hypothetical protein